MLQQVSKPLTKWQWYEFTKKGASWKAVENDGKRTRRARYVGVFCQERARVKRFQEEAEEERRAGKQGQWQLESLARKCSEQVKCCNDTDCTHRMMKQSFLVLKGGDWENTFRKEVKVSEWAFDRIKEAFEKVAKDEARKLSTVQESRKKVQVTCDASSREAEGQGGVTMSHLCPHCNSFPMEDYVWWVSGGEKHTNWWCCGTGSNQTGSWWCKQAKVFNWPRSSERMQYLMACVGI